MHRQHILVDTLSRQHLFLSYLQCPSVHYYLCRIVSLHWKLYVCTFNLQNASSRPRHDRPPWARPPHHQLRPHGRGRGLPMDTLPHHGPDSAQGWVIFIFIFVWNWICCAKSRHTPNNKGMQKSSESAEKVHVKARERPDKPRKALPCPEISVTFPTNKHI